MSTSAARLETTENPESELPLDPEQVRKASISKRTLVDVAAACGLGQAAFSRHLRSHPKLRTAYDEGRALYRAANPAKPPKPKPRSDNRIRNKYSPEDVERIAAEVGSKGAVARELGYADYSGLRDRFQSHPEFNAALARGLAQFTAEHPEAKSAKAKVKPKPRGGVTQDATTELKPNDHNSRPKPEDPHISEAAELPNAANDPEVTEMPKPANVPFDTPDLLNSSLVRGRDEAIEPAATAEPQGAAPAQHDVHHRFITFERGSQVLVGFEGNFFHLKPKERELLTQLTEIFDAYENRDRYYSIRNVLISASARNVLISADELAEAFDQIDSEPGKPPSRWKRFTRFLKRHVR